MAEQFREDSDELWFLPLGGSSEIGMNLNLYCYAGRWMMVDLGITFGDDATPGLDVIMPDMSFIEARKDKLSGLVLTHGHEDHIGAVPYLWERLGCPIYATPFTASLVRRKLQDAGLLHQVELIEVPISGNFVVGPFEIELITLTHSIPEPNAMAIRTGAGIIFHTGDWKFDPDPQIGDVSDFDALQKLGEEGVLALIGDSTNVFVDGQTGSEGDVLEGLTELFGRIEGGIAVSCFASNVARIESIIRAAAANDRHVGLVGWSLWRMKDAAQENGYLQDLPQIVGENEIGFLPKEHRVIVCTGSQGEPRAALNRIADGQHPHVTLGRGDTVIFSSRHIPGNELAIGRLQNKLSGLGIEIINDGDDVVHVSGHPGRDELARMYQLIRPQIAVPVHGDAIRLREHAKLAQQCQVPQSVVPANGSLIRLAPGPAEIVDWVEHGYLTFDGGRLRSLSSAVIRDRRKLLHNGSAAITLVMDRKGDLAADPRLTLTGIIEADEHDRFADDVIDKVCDEISSMRAKFRSDDGKVEDAARRIIRRAVKVEFGMKPRTDVHLIRV